MTLRVMRAPATSDSPQEEVTVAVKREAPGLGRVTISQAFSLHLAT
jgi:hypothetical protein